MTKKSSIKNLAGILSCLILSFCILLTPAAFAQHKEVSENERAVFSFFKLIDGEPNFDQWVRNSSKYLEITDRAAQDQLYQIETLRLKWGFGTHDVEGDSIKIRTPIKIALSGAREKGRLSFLFPTTSGGQAPYFPFEYGKESIALIVGDIDRFLSVTIAPDEYDFIRKLMNPNTPYEGEIVLRIKASKADGSAPLPLDGVDQWLMMGDTGYLELIFTPPGDTEKVLWSYTAPWYYTSTEQSLLPLLSK
jgi:hypothetical protein